MYDCVCLVTGEDGRYLGVVGEGEAPPAPNSLAISAGVAAVVSLVVLVVGLLTKRLVDKINRGRINQPVSGGLGGHTPRFLGAASWGFSSVRSKFSAAGMDGTAGCHDNNDLVMDAVSIVSGSDASSHTKP